MLIIINPPDPVGMVSNKDMMGGLGQIYPASGAKVPPIDIPYIAAYLRSRKIHFEIIECSGLSYSVKELIVHLRNVRQKEGEIILAIRTSLPTARYDLNIAKTIKKDFDITIIIFGPYAAISPDFFLADQAVDAVVVSEPECVFADVIINGFENSDGVWYKSKDGVVIKNKQRDNISDLNALPFPAWEYMPYQKYILHEPQFKSEDFFLSVSSSRGCPFACGYCPYPLVQGKVWRFRTAENIVSELKYLIEKFNVKNILFRDPEFTLDRNRIIEMCRLISEQKLDFNWRCETRLDTLDPELVEKMAKAGCCGMNFGIETSTADVARKSGRKPYDAEQIFTVISACKKMSINTFCFFIVGLPGQDKAEVLKMVDLAKKIDPDEAQFSFATPYPGTHLQKWARDHNYIFDENFTHYTGYRPVMRNDYFNKRKLVQIRNFAQLSMDMRASCVKYRLDRAGVAQYAKELAKKVLFFINRLFI
jgi:radical SAM superfamily enzyme YgiQ (UPF0313 family)